MGIFKIWLLRLGGLLEYFWGYLFESMVGKVNKLYTMMRLEKLFKLYCHLLHFFAAFILPKISSRPIHKFCPSICLNKMTKNYF